MSYINPRSGHISLKTTAMQFSPRLPECLLKRLQFVQNCAAKLVLGRHKFDCSREALAELHWLPIKAWIDFKVLTLVHKCLSGLFEKLTKDLKAKS